MVEEIIIKVLTASWDILVESSGYILFGFFIAGLLKAFVPEDLVAKHLGKGKFSSVFKASAFGVPIPLCSCGVLPAAAGLREQGASKGATASFLISTPETGVDSIAVTWALLDPVMTVLRPVSAFLTAISTGIAVNLLGKDKPEKPDQKPDPKIDQKPEMLPMMQQTCSSGCACAPVKKESLSLMQKLSMGMRFAFGDLFEDISKWFIAGVLIAGAITAFVSPAWIEAYLGSGLLSMIAILLIAVPLYVCATASTPIAAALALKGLSPGAALVFLLAGPATNAASLTVVTKIIGKKGAVIYLMSIIISTLLLGVATNVVYGALGMNISSWIQENAHNEHGIAAIAFTVVLLGLITKSLIPGTLFKSDKKKKNSSQMAVQHKH